jgi:transposase-like protein
METTEKFDWAVAASRARWTTAVARQVLAALSASGLSRHEFADKHGIHEQRLYNWQRRLVETEAGNSVQFRELAAPAVSLDPRLEVVLPSGVLLRVPPGFDAAAVARLLEILGCAG